MGSLLEENSRTNEEISKISFTSLENLSGKSESAERKLKEQDILNPVETSPISGKSETEERMRSPLEENSKISSTSSKKIFKQKQKKKIPVDTNQLSEKSGKKSKAVNRDYSDSEEEDVFEYSSEKIRKTDESTKKPKIVIVMAGLSKDAIKLVMNATKSLPKISRIDQNVTDQTTHIISTEKTNIKVLKGISMGCWILRIEWISKSLEEKQWVDPETYEIADFGRAVRKNREHRQLFGRSFVHLVFSKCRKFYVGEGTTVPKNKLLELITLAGGKIEKSKKSAKIVIGLGGLKETWIFNSIKNGKVEPVKPYRTQEIL